MWSTSVTRACLSRVFSGNSSSSSDFFEDSDDSYADKDFVLDQADKMETTEKRKP